MAVQLSGRLTHNGKLKPSGRILLRVLAAVLIVGAISSVRDEARVALNAAHADATVVAVRLPDDQTNAYQADIHFTTTSGTPVDTTITMQKQRRIPEARPGELLPIMYSRDNARDAVPLGRHAVWPSALIFAGVGMLCGWVSRL